MKEKAKAWKEYGQAALIQPLLESLPQLAAAVAQPLAHAERLVLISSGGGDSDGAAATKIARDITIAVAQLPILIESLTGIDILGTLKNLPGVKTVDERLPEQPRGLGGDSPHEETEVRA